MRRMGLLKNGQRCGVQFFFSGIIKTCIAFVTVVLYLSLASIIYISQGLPMPRHNLSLKRLISCLSDCNL